SRPKRYAFCRTPDQVVRSHLLYPAELRVRDFGVLVLFVTATNSDCISGDPERLIRHLAKPNTSPLRGGFTAVQNATRFVELPTKWFEATYSIQLSYGCVTLVF